MCHERQMTIEYYKRIYNQLLHNPTHFTFSHPRSPTDCQFHSITHQLYLCYATVVLILWIPTITKKHVDILLTQLYSPEPIQSKSSMKLSKKFFLPLLLYILLSSDHSVCIIHLHHVKVYLNLGRKSVHLHHKICIGAHVGH